MSGGEHETELTFNECMAVIRQADWPKTLHFIRDPAGPDLKPCLKEGWAKFGEFRVNVQNRLSNSPPLPLLVGAKLNGVLNPPK